MDVVANTKPTCLIDCSTQAGVFTKEVIQEMHKHNSRPIVFPLSNPTRLHEVFPEDLMKWTNNNALVATGSLFEPVDGYRISQNNNYYSFPSIGLSAVLSCASHIGNRMISAAVDQLAATSMLTEGDSTPGLLPGLEVIADTSTRIAAAVILAALDEGIAIIKETLCTDNANENIKVLRDFEKCVKWVKKQMWTPVYRPLIKVKYNSELHTNQI